MKKILIVVLSIALATTMFAGCSGTTTPSATASASAAVSSQSTAAVETQASSAAAPATGNTSKDIVMIAKMYQNPWYQVAFNGAKDAGAKFGFNVTTEGPGTGSDIQAQVDEVNAAVNKKPYGLIIDAIDAKSLGDAMAKAKQNNVNVIAFDGAIPGYDNILATITTDNKKAGALAADTLFADQGFKDAISKGTAQNPTLIGAMSEDGTSTTLIDRMAGFIDEMSVDIQTLDGFQGAVDVSGEPQWAKASTQPAKVKIITLVPTAATQADLQSTAATMLAKPNLVAIYACNNGTVDGLLSATNGGTQLDKTNGKYKNLYAVGFDAGKALKDAVRNKEFFGAITQDPYTIGYDSVKDMSLISQGQKINDEFPAAIWWDSTNMDQADIAKLLYD